MAGYLNEFIANLPLVCQRKNFENRLTFGEVMGKSLMSRFLTHGVVLLSLNSQRSLVCMFNKNSLFCTYSFTQHLWATQSSSIHHDIGTTYTHIRITALCPETTHVSRYQKGKTNLDFTEARDSQWQWHQLGHMQVCTSLQTDNHVSTPSLSFYRPDALPAAQPTVSKHWRHYLNDLINRKSFGF